MNSKTRLGNTASVVGTLFAVVMFIGLLSGNVLADEPDDWDKCSDDALPDGGPNANAFFTQDFLIDDCQFKANGATPYFILKPGYQRILVTPDGAEEPEMSIETVLCKTKTINLDGRKIKTRVYEERALEWDDEDGGEWVTVEISLNWFAICKQTNDVYYFGEWSRDCEDGFDENDECENEDNEGSWEAGVDGAMPGIMMPGTFLLGAKYFQEIAPPNAVDRGENAAMGLDWPEEGDPEYTDCVQIFDTNPAEGECGRGWAGSGPGYGNGRLWFCRLQQVSTRG
jgi:hypothetical protein